MQVKHMNKQQRDALVNLLQQYEELIAENQALKAILGDTTSGWQRKLDRLMKSPAREAYRKQFSPVLEKIDSVFRDAEFVRLFSKIPATGPIQ